MAQIARSTYSAGDRNWEIFLHEIVIRYPGISQLVEARFELHRGRFFFLSAWYKQNNWTPSRFPLES